MNRSKRLAAVAAGLVLTACGGGGSSGTDSGTSGSSTTPATQGKVTLTGVVAKGLTTNADIAVYAVDAATGLPGSTPVATGVTRSNGTYGLSAFTYDSGTVYVVKATARSDGTTTHQDEVTGQTQTLPAGFQLRGAIRPVAPSTTSPDLSMTVSLTPFSEMAVAAAARATGGLTPVNAAQGLSTVTQLLGVDPQTTTAGTVASATSAEERRLAVLLTAVSELSSEQALGCTQTEAGARATCVVEQLAASSSTTTMALTTGGTNVAAALDSALNTVLDNPALVGSIPAEELVVADTNLGCSTQATCTPTTVTVTSAVDSAINATKSFIANLKADLLSMFSQGGAEQTATGAVNQQAYAFRTATDGVYMPLRTLIADSGTLLLAVDLYNDWMAGRTTSPDRSRGDGDLVPNDGAWDYTNMTIPVGCSLFTDSSLTTKVTTGQTPGGIWCGARYYFTNSTDGSATSTEWRHAFSITPNADGTFGWRSRAQIRAFGGNASSTFPQGSSLYHSGTVTPTLSATHGSIRSFTITGDLPAAWDDTTLVGYRNALSLSGSTTDASGDVSTRVMSGTLTSYDSTGTVTTSLTLRPGSQIVSGPRWSDGAGNQVGPLYTGAVRNGTGPTAMTLSLLATTPTAELEGSFSMGDIVWDRDNLRQAPGSTSLSMAARTLSNGTRTEFINGTLTATVTGWANYRDTQPDSATNHYTIGTTFTGNVTAPDRPTLRMIAGTSIRADGSNDGDGKVLSSSLTFTTLANGTATRTLTISPTHATSDGSVTRTVITEAASGVHLTVLRDSDDAPLLYNQDGTVIGHYARGDRRLNFTNGDYLSLDFGL